MNSTGLSWGCDNQNCSNNAADHPDVESSDSPAVEYLILSPGGIVWKYILYKCISRKCVFQNCISQKCIFQLPPDVDSSDSPVQ